MAEQREMLETGLDEIEKIRQGKERVLREIRKVIIGQERIVNDVLMAFFAGGHCLITGVPGLAKTLLISSLGRAMDLKFRRVPVHAGPHAGRHHRSEAGWEEDGTTHNAA